jgi:hypothetical protein
MKLIKLSKGKETMVDDEDFEFLSQWKWYAHERNSNKFYAVRKIRDKDGKEIAIKMHRCLLDAPTGLIVDHIDGNSLNNQKLNLRICSNADNLKNRPKPKTNKLGYKGVSRSSSSKKNPFTASIKSNNQVFYLGAFPNNRISRSRL